MKRNIIPSGTKLPVKLIRRERDLIQNETFCGPDFAVAAVEVDNVIQVDLSLDEIEDIQGYVAAEANHTKNSKLENELDRLFNKLQAYLDADDEMETQ